MTDIEKVDNRYQDRARAFVDMLFDYGLFHNSLTRKDLQSIEDLVAYEYQSHAKYAEQEYKFYQTLQKTKKK